MGKQGKFTRIYLWRHPAVAGWREGRVYGHQDVALAKDGRRQIQAIVKCMEGERLGAIYSSDLQRARLVAEAVGRSHSPRLKPDSVPALRELSLGIWEGLTYQEINRDYPAQLRAREKDLIGFRIEGGESLGDLAARVVPAFMKMVADHKGAQICVVAHAGVNRVLLASLLGAPLDRIFRIAQDYATLNLIDVFEDGTPVVQRMNHTPAEVEE